MSAAFTTGKPPASHAALTDTACSRVSQTFDRRLPLPRLPSWTRYTLRRLITAFRFPRSTDPAHFAMSLTSPWESLPVCTEHITVCTACARFRSVCGVSFSYLRGFIGGPSRIRTGVLALRGPRLTYLLA